MPRPTWDETFFDAAHVFARRSKDTSTKLGAVAVGPNNEIRAVGYNCFPRGVNDNVPDRYERPLKYKWFEHAERNLFYNAARIGTSLSGCTLYVPWIPCTDCARGVIQTGIVEVVVQDFVAPTRWRDDFDISLEMLREASIPIREANHTNSKT